jgi:hypothetical protein
MAALRGLYLAPSTTPPTLWLLPTAVQAGLLQVGVAAPEGRGRKVDVAGALKERGGGMEEDEEEVKNGKGKEARREMGRWSVFRWSGPVGAARRPGASPPARCRRYAKRARNHP